MHKTMLMLYDFMAEMSEGEFEMIFEDSAVAASEHWKSFCGVEQNLVKFYAALTTTDQRLFVTHMMQRTFCQFPNPYVSCVIRASNHVATPHYTCEMQKIYWCKNSKIRGFATSRKFPARVNFFYFEVAEPQLSGMLLDFCDR